MFIESRLKPSGNIASTGYCGEKAYYAYYEGNVIVVSGNGAIEEKAFYNRSFIKSVVIGDGITSVGASAFSSCDVLSSVELGNGVETIGNGAFTYCTALTNITIPENVLSIESRAFDSSGLSSVFIGKHVSFIGKSAFGNCEFLASITVDENNLYYSSKNGVLFNKDKTVLLAYPSGKTNSSYAISSSVTEIGESAFSNCKNLKAVILNDGLKTINGNAFYGCEGLTDISIPDSVEILGDSAFGFCTSLRNVNLGKGLKSIGSYAFAFAWIKSVKIPPSVVQIGKMAFGYTFADEKISSVGVIGIGGTAAEAFASEHNFSFIDLSEVVLNDEKLSVSDGIIRGISEKTSVSEFLGLLNAEEIIITESNGNVLETEAFVGTGSVVKIIAFGSVVNEITIVVNGDIDGNGELS
ncbi:MAG: leucine-rich repeat domain-containing protein, partial [Clostridia bacterium]|nr:leucine-rich repeat domain-containing protein [Clostridia bacterium]